MVAFDPWASFDADKEEAAKAPSSKPLPAGNYNVTLYEAEVKPFTNKTDSPYAGLKALAVTLKVADGDYAGRQIWDRVGLFPKYAPSAKNPQGALNRNFFALFQKSLGIDDDTFRSIAQRIAKGEDITAQIKPYLGRAFSVKTNVGDPDDYNPEGRTEVGFYNAALGAPKPTAAAADAWAAAGPSGGSADPWGSTPKEDAGLAAAAANSQGF